MKLNYTKEEVKFLQEKIYFTEEELKILEYWVLDYTIVKMADLLNISTRTVNRRKKRIRDKLKRLSER